MPMKSMAWIVSHGCMVCLVSLFGMVQGNDCYLPVTALAKSLSIILVLTVTSCSPLRLSRYSAIHALRGKSMRRHWPTFSVCATCQRRQHFLRIFTKYSPVIGYSVSRILFMRNAIGITPLVRPSGVL